ncbi:hypothetical protein GCM10011584_02260 [Nocardioides phosphati]|uniref:Uncharacterized protein n=1 Tax=Nocardioides phosphati TaxID=1867775 RepID=A0ABQ2N6E2_9ACTN|nr:hypothetical protein [Nocardioides phosphati]GGO84523.1 hypothetical protein GCM10011584_02260 [Nocardioides phosphati]
MNRTVHGVAVATLAATTLLTGCSRSTEPSAAPTAHAAEVTFGDATGKQCVGRGGRYLAYETVSTDSPVTLTGVDLAGASGGARLLRAWSSDVSGEKVPHTGLIAATTPDVVPARQMHWAQRRALAGTAVPAGRDDVVVIAQLDLPAGSAYDALTLRWKAADGTSGTSDLTVRTTIGPGCAAGPEGTPILRGGGEGLCTRPDAEGGLLWRSFVPTQDVEITAATLGGDASVRRSWIVPVDPGRPFVALTSRHEPIGRAHWSDRAAVTGAAVEKGHTYAWVGDVDLAAPWQADGLDVTFKDGHLGGADTVDLAFRVARRC